MKKWTLFLWVLAAAFLAGCVKGEHHVTIHSDGSADYAIMVALDKSVQSMVQETDPFSEMNAVLDKNGFAVTEFRDGQFVGIKGTKHFSDATKLSILSADDTAQAPFTFTEDKGLFSSTYRLKGNFDFGNKQGDTDEMQQMGNMLADQMDFTFKLTMPGEIVSHNASAYDASTNTLTWNLLASEENLIELEGTVPNTLNIAILIGLVLILVGGLVWLFVKQRNRSL